MPDLRRAVIGSSAAVASAGLMLALAFGVLLEPGKEDAGSCQTGLYPGDYASLLLPLHLAALAVLLASLAVVSRPLGHGRVTAIALSAATAFVVACLVFHPLFSLYGVAALVLSIPATGALAIGLFLRVVAARRRPSVELRWAGLAEASWIGQWTALLMVLPAAYTFAYLNGAGMFCF